MTANKVKSLEELYKRVHADIRKSPARAEKKKKDIVRKKISKKGDKALVFENSVKKQWTRHTKLSKEERKERIAKKIIEATKKAQKKGK